MNPDTPGFIDVGQVAFVAEKLVYIAQTSDKKWYLVVNDKPGPAYGGVKNFLVFENDGSMSSDIIRQYAGDHNMDIVQVY